MITFAPVIVIFLLIMATLHFFVLRHVPENQVQPGSQISQNTRDTLVNHYILSPDDQIEFFYSYGRKSVLEGGAILTDDLLIHYAQGENQRISVFEIHVDELDSVELIENTRMDKIRIYRVNAVESGIWLNIALSAKDQGDKAFIQALQYKLSQRNLNIHI
ncbi:hypothetical protein KDD30_18735 (plasmid) [Photobacterium sp. GJ3]|uniref:hypothetical protein n=1 Tax=Photobacterium sp. GJ3 TaxID=2829502 RepID=UPI001B8A9084|nr:hypothetical protein [Photobacterium sp. GJ3]QUJ70169.1 hypothetical protein KDD30_18735 [Photobacterium sp. GJ3]